MLLTVEQTNELLLKNHDLRLVGAKVVLEANANENRNTFRGRGQRSERDSGKFAHHNNKSHKKCTYPKSEQRQKAYAET